jgi:hypothetical protein
MLGCHSVRKPGLKSGAGIFSNNTQLARPASHAANMAPVLRGASDEGPGPQRYRAPRTTPGSTQWDNHESEPSIPLPFDSFLDAFLTEAQRTPFTQALESTLRTAMGYADVIFWLDVPSLEMLVSPQRNVATTYGSGLAGVCRCTMAATRVQFPTKHPGFNSVIDGPMLPPASSVFLLPLTDF